MVEDDDHVRLAQLGPVLEVDPGRLAPAVRTGGPATLHDGRTVADALTGSAVAAAHLAQRKKEAVWPASSIALRHDWTEYAAVVVAGATAATVAPIIGDHHRDLTLRAEADPTAPEAGTDEAVLLVLELEQRPDAAAAAVLAAMAGGNAKRILVADRFTPVDEDCIVDRTLQPGWLAGRRRHRRRRHRLGHALVGAGPRPSLQEGGAGWVAGR